MFLCSRRAESPLLKSPHRIVLHFPPARGADGLLLEFSDDPATIQQRERAHRARADVLTEAPLDLYALDVPHPFRRWALACDELRRDRESESRAQKHHADRALILILAQLAWERRGSPGYCPTRDDLDEAELHFVSLLRRGLR